MSNDIEPKIATESTQMMKGEVTSQTDFDTWSAAAHGEDTDGDSMADYHSSAGSVSSDQTIVAEPDEAMNTNTPVANGIDSSILPVPSIKSYNGISNKRQETEITANGDGGYFLKLPIADQPLAMAGTPIESPTAEESRLLVESLSAVPGKGSEVLSSRRGSLVDPKTGITRKYIKLDEEIGRGSFKTVYKGLDVETGVNVAWCELMDVARNTKAARLKFKEEVEMLKGLRHQNILRFYDSWEHNKKIVLVTELMTSGTLKQYIKRFRKVNVKLIANWCRQILNGLVFLHTRTPPVIHRDLKCDNFFINGQTGRVKIGDLGLAILKPQSFARTVIGTPEYMAPEMYEEHYDESVDVYAFGMCMLEMATLEYPYKECTNPAQIYRKVTKGIKPDSFQRIESPAIRNIIDSCIQTTPADRMKASELLQLDFFNEWSVHIECTVTSRPAVLRFRITDDVMRNKKEIQKDGEAVQFDFNMATDEPEMVAQDLVNSGYLDKGNVKVAVRIMVEKITYFRKLRLSRSNSLNNEQHSNQPSLNRACSESPLHPSTVHCDGVSCTRCKNAADPMSKRQEVMGDSKAGNVPSNGRKHPVRTSFNDSEPKLLRKRKSLKVLIQEIATKDDSTIVTCELHSGKATVTFTFNCDLDKADEITVNLEEYLVSGEQQKAANEQIEYIIDTVKAHKDQPDRAKYMCEQRVSSNTTSSNIASATTTPCHSRSSSKDLLDMRSHLPSTSVGEKEIIRPIPLPIAGHLLDEACPRDRSTTWSSNSLSKEPKPETGRKMSEPLVADHPSISTFKPSSLAVIQSTPVTPNLSRKIYQSQPWQNSHEDICIHDECKWEDKSHSLKKSLDITELGKSIENIMSGQTEKNLYSGHINHPYGHSRSLTSSPLLRRVNRTRQLSSTRADGEIISPNDSLSTNSTAFNSLTYDSGFFSMQPPPPKPNITSEPIAETTKKVGRFAVGVVNEQIATSPVRPSPSVKTPVEGSPTILSPQMETAIPVATSIANDTPAPVSATPSAADPLITDLNPVLDTKDPISHVKTASSVTQTECSNHQSEMNLEIDHMLTQLRTRHAVEMAVLESKHRLELEHYLKQRKTALAYRNNCSRCAVLQGNLSLCEVHKVANSLQSSPTQNKEPKVSTYTSRAGEATPRHLLCATTKGLDYVSNLLRTGSDGGGVRRIRHNSVEQLLQRMKSTDGEMDSPCSPGSGDSVFTITEETESNVESHEQPFSFPAVDQQTITKYTQDYQTSSGLQKERITNELISSHDSVLKGLQSISESITPKQPLGKSSSSPLLIHSQQRVVKQALSDSRAQIMQTLSSLDH